MLSDFNKALGRFSHEERVDILFKGILTDVDVKMIGQPIAQLVSFFSNPCVHIGHSLLDENKKNFANDVIELYKMSLMGKNVSREWRNSKYNLECMYAGISVQCNIVEEYLKNQNSLSEYMKVQASNLIFK